MCEAGETEEIEQTEAALSFTTLGWKEGRGLHGGRSTAPLALPVGVVSY